MAGKKKSSPPVKLAWRENVVAWVNENRRAVPKGVSRPAAHAVIGMLMQSADSTGRNVVASARWLERETGVNHVAAAKFVTFLVRAGWLVFVGVSDRGVPIYDLLLRTITPQSEDDADDIPPRSDSPQLDTTSEVATAEATAEANAEDYSTTTDHRVLRGIKGRDTSGWSATREKPDMGYQDDDPERPFPDRDELPDPF